MNRNHHPHRRKDFWNSVDPPTRRSSSTPTAPSTWRAPSGRLRRSGAAHAAQGTSSAVSSTRGRSDERRTVLELRGSTCRPTRRRRRSSGSRSWRTTSSAPTPDNAGFPNGRRPNDDVTDIGSGRRRREPHPELRGRRRRVNEGSAGFVPAEPVDGRSRRHVGPGAVIGPRLASGARRSTLHSARLSLPLPGLARGEGAPRARRGAVGGPRACALGADRRPDVCGRRASVDRALELDPSASARCGPCLVRSASTSSVRRGRRPSWRWRDPDDWASWANLTGARRVGEYDRAVEAAVGSRRCVGVRLRGSRTQALLGDRATTIATPGRRRAAEHAQTRDARMDAGPSRPRHRAIGNLAAATAPTSARSPRFRLPPGLVGPPARAPRPHPGGHRPRRSAPPSECRQRSAEAPRRPRRPGRRGGIGAPVRSGARDGRLAAAQGVVRSRGPSSSTTTVTWRTPCGWRDDAARRATSTATTSSPGRSTRTGGRRGEARRARAPARNRGRRVPPPPA